jgi:hypothetical protein
VYETSSLRLRLRSHAAKKEKTDAVREAKSVVSADEKLLKKLIDTTGRKQPMRQAMDGVLKSVKVQREAYHGGKLNGNHCGLVAEHCAKVVEGWRATMKNDRFRRTEFLPDDADAQIDELCDTVLKLLNALHRIIKMTARVNHPATDEECKTFKQTVEYYSMVRRKEVKKLSLSPKFHALEVHMVEQFCDLRELGNKAEEVVESSHHVDGNLHKKYASISDYYERALFIQHRKSQAKHPDVVAAIAAFTAATERNFSAASRDKRADKEEARLQAEVQREKALDDEIAAFFADPENEFVVREL